MALSIHKSIAGPMWPLGLILVPTPGTPVNIMSLVDANNNNAPETVVGPGGAGLGTAPTCHKIFIQAVKANANNNGLTTSTGNVYLCTGPAGGNGGKADYGCVLFVLQPGQSATWPASEVERDSVSPYRFFIDADSANDGALVCLQV